MAKKTQRKRRAAARPDSRRPYSLKNALLTKMRATEANGELCSDGVARLKWWLKEGKAFPTITEALKGWTPQKIDALLEWLGMTQVVASGINYNGYLDAIVHKITSEWDGITSSQGTPLIKEITAAFKKVLGPDVESFVRNVIKTDHYFDEVLKDWNWGA